MEVIGATGVPPPAHRLCGRISSSSLIKTLITLGDLITCLLRSVMSKVGSIQCRHVFSYISAERSVKLLSTLFTVLNPSSKLSGQLQFKQRGLQFFFKLVINFFFTFKEEDWNLGKCAWHILCSSDVPTTTKRVHLECRSVLVTVVTSCYWIQSDMRAKATDATPGNFPNPVISFCVSPIRLTVN